MNTMFNALRNCGLVENEDKKQMNTIHMKSSLISDFLSAHV